MATWTKVAAAVAATVIVAWLCWPDDGAVVPPGGNATGTADAAATASSIETAGPVVETEPPGPARTAVAFAPTRDPRLATIRGRCVDEHRNPVANCEVELRGWAHSSERMEAWMLENAAEPDWQDPDPITTGLDGRFEFTFLPPPPFQFVLDVTRDGLGAMYARWSELAEGSVTDVGPVSMTPGVRIVGRVVDEHGEPVVKTHVRFGFRQPATNDSHDGSGMQPLWGTQVWSGEQGSFAAKGCFAPGTYDVGTASDPGQSVLSPTSLELVAERPLEDVTVVVRRAPPRAEIAGRVVDEHGQPVAEVTIEDRSGDGRAARTRSRRDGTFRLLASADAARTNALLAVSADRFEVETPEPREVAWGTSDVEVSVTRGATLTLRVTDEDGAPVEHYTVRLIPRHRRGIGAAAAAARAQGRHENGTVVIAGLTSGDWLLLVEFSEASGLGPLFESLRQEANVPRRLDLTAAAPARRLLRVVGSDDTPIAGTTVLLCDPFDRPFEAARTLMRRESWLRNLGSNEPLVLFEGRTDAEGRIELRGPAGRDLGVSVRGPMHVPLSRSGIRLELAGECVLQVSTGARLTGRIVPPEAVAELARLAGSDTAGFSDRRRPHLRLIDAQRRRFPADHRALAELPGLYVADDGSFDASGLPAGEWQVVVSGHIAQGPFATSHSFAAGSVSLADGGTTRRDLDLAYVIPGTIEGVVQLNGAPYANDTVSLDGNGTWVNLETDAEGRFTHLCMPGDYEVLLQKRGTNRDRTMLRCLEQVHVVRGETTRQTFGVQSSKLEVTVVDANGKPQAGMRVNARDGSVHGTELPPTDERGVTEAELTTATVVLRVLPRAFASTAARRQPGGTAESRWIELATVALTAAESRTIEVRLPADY